MSGASARFTLAELEILIEQGLDATADEDAHQFSQPAEMVGGPAGVLNFLDIPTGDAFDVAPDDAIALFQAKKLKPTFGYADMLGKAHVQAFTVAKMMDVDMLGQVRTSLESAMANGTPFKEWADGIIPMLQGAGWWGRKEVIDPLTGKTVVAQLGSPHRLETIFRTNMQMAYAEQQWETIESQKDIAPYLMYDAVDDYRTRPSHKARDNTILPVGHPWWSKNTPPLGYNCRCGIIQLTKDELDALGKLPNTKPPALGTYQWTNPRTGHVHEYPDGIDPGFDYNVGKFGVKQKLDKLMAEKVGILPPDMQQAVHEALKKAPTISETAVDAAVSAQKALAEAKAAAALQKAAEQAAIAAKNAEAKKAIQEIAGGQANGANLWLKKAYDYLSKISGYSNGTPTEQLDAIKGKAADLAAKNKLAGTLSAYKKKVLEGKTPTPSQKKAFESLSQQDQDAFLAKIDKEKAAIEAKKAAELAAQEKAAAADAKVVPGKVASDGPNMADLVQIGPQKGSNPGGLFQDTLTGEKWYIKTPATDDIARNEVLAAKLYELAGVEVPELHLVTLNGKTGVASRIVDGLVKGDAAALASAAGTAEGFAVDAWLANWDVVGLGYDNLLIKAGRVVRVDTGGALRYRAQGGLKGSAFGDTITELGTLRDASVNKQAASIFGKLTSEQVEASAGRVLAIDDNKIRAMVEQYGPAAAADRKALVDTLIARKADLAKRFPNLTAAAQEAKKLAVEAAGFAAKDGLAEIDGAIVTAIKGIATRAKAGATIEAKDVERVKAAKEAWQAWKAAHGKYVMPAALAEVDGYYNTWIDDLAEAVQGGIGSQAKWSGGFFDPFKGRIEIDSARVPFKVVPAGSQKFSQKEAKSVIKEALGDYAANINVPKREGSSALKDVPLEHKRAITVYTGSYYRQVNDALRSGTASPAVKRYAELLNEALSMAPKYVGEVTRGLSLSGKELDQFVKDHQSAWMDGTTIEHKGFISSSKGSRAAFGGNVVMHMQSKNGVFVKPISLHPSENEVLLKHGARFSVTDMKDVDGKLHVYLTEV